MKRVCQHRRRQSRADRSGTISSQQSRHYHDYPRRSASHRRTHRNGSSQLIRVIRWAVLLSAALAVLVVLSLILIGLAVVNQARQDEAAPSDAIVVLGTAQWDGRPSTTFRARLDHAHSLYLDGYADLIVLTGGVAPGDIYSEAEVGAYYLRGLNVPEEHLLSVPVGMNSRESLEEAATELLNRDRERVILVSDAFHMFRVKQIASNLGLDPLGSPTTTSPIRPGSPAEQHYVMREVLAYVNYLVFDS
jgi:uncharacterized SAM-binding protein YcdF (DUF218 family)